MQAIEYLAHFGYTREQAYLLLGVAPIEGRIGGVLLVHAFPSKSSNKIFEPGIKVDGVAQHFRGHSRGAIRQLLDAFVIVGEESSMEVDWVGAM